MNDPARRARVDIRTGRRRAGSLFGDLPKAGIGPIADCAGRLIYTCPRRHLLEVVMGRRNYLIEGVSGAGKTTAADELQRRGHHVIHGDRVLAYLGDPETGEALAWPTESVTDKARWRHERWIWDVSKVKSAVADQSYARSFFCGSSRNHHHFIRLFNGIFVLSIDTETLNLRLAGRPRDEFGGKSEERQLIARVHATEEDIPKNGVNIDATTSVTRVVDEILSKCEEAERGAG